MPTNVTAEYKKAEEAFRRAREPRERLECLREMMRTIPRQKSTEHLHAEIAQDPQCCSVDRLELVGRDQLDRCPTQTRLGERSLFGERRSL